MPLNVLVIGDIVGKLGRRTVAGLLPDIKRSHNIDFVIANGENTAGGRGLTPATAQELYESGVDVITSGNHIWENREIYPTLEKDRRILRPINYPEGTIGCGIYSSDALAVVNVMGRTFMGVHLDCPFRAMDAALNRLRGCHIIIVDLHAEATSEKIAMGFYLDGRTSAVFGTHTHVPTSDARVLQGGTGYISDVGMVGALRSVLGMAVEPVIERFLTQLPNRFEPVEKGPAVFNSIVLQIDERSGKTISIQRLDREVA
ncbi:MAG TPA: TIGR00282 family metallophosphoesterase [Dehalococcoidia bacterium]|nr:TIGR00282 family metallophosphoesterase [Dehalococcoidia bacterium]